MDLPGLLDSIIECSICLERLKHDSRVLPCQHTFCISCLKSVQNKTPNSPISCPECRQPTNILDIDSLPRNVFLIRLLDQFKQTSSDEKTSLTPNTAVAASDPEPKQSKCPNESQSSIPYAKALYDFQMNPMDDEGCLKFQKGMIIQVTRRVDQNWAEGKLGDVVGIFPLSFVNMNAAATSLMASYATKWRLPASMPPPANKDQAASTSALQQRLLQPIPAPALVNPPPSASTNGQSIHDKTGIYISLHNYAPQKPDELELKKGSQYIVTESCQDGWLKGTCSANPSVKGVFPGNYVMPLIFHQKIMSMQRNAALQGQNSPSNSQQPTGAYTNLGLSTLPELPQRNLNMTVPQRTAQSPPAQTAPGNKINENSPPNALTQKTDENVNKQRKETVTEILMKKLGYRKSNDSSAYSMDNPVFEDALPLTSSAAKNTKSQLQYNHMRSGSCPSRFVCPTELGVMSQTNVEKLQFGSQRVKTRERTALPMLNPDEKSITAHKRHSINLSGPPGPSKNSQNAQLKANHRKSSSLDTTLDGTNSSQPPVRYRCVTKYPANSRFELSLNLGDVIILHKKRDNGWYKGELIRTGQVGLFPANFVEIIGE